jgi:TonB family protein
MKILRAAKYGAAAWCLAAVSALPAAADEPASCYRPGAFALLSNGDVVKPGANFDLIYKTHTLVPYPAESQRRREQGITIFSVSIGADGTPTGVTVTRSSASQRLNDSAIEYIKAQWRWPSLMKVCGQNTTQTVVNVIWNEVYSTSIPKEDFHVKMPVSAYPPGALDKLETGYPTLLEMETDAQGAVTDGRVIHTSGFPDLDDQALAIVKNSPALLKGRAAGKYVLSADWDMPLGTLPAGETEIRTGREPK